MTLDEAIKHAEEVAKKQENNAKYCPRPDKSVKGSGKKYNAYLKCAEEHRQLAEWLIELKRKRQVIEDIKAELWMEGMNMTGEYQGVWVRYRDIERVIDKHISGEKMLESQERSDKE